MIIDCHGHYTTAPGVLNDFREAQLRSFDAGGATPEPPRFSEDEIRESIEQNQLKMQLERGVDFTLFSPRALGMGHHLGDQKTSNEWARLNNDLIKRVVDLFPQHFAGVCQLPQSAGVDIRTSVEELERCILELGFVGCNLNPDPSGGYWTSDPLTDRSWYPFFEKLVELNVPAMIHVSGSCNPNFHATGAHYLNADTTAFMQFIQGDLFQDFPDLRFIIPHGGGAAPYHWGRYKGLSDRLNRPHPEEHVMTNVYFDTCVYHQPGINLLFEVVPLKNILFASELIGAVRTKDPKTGFYYDDTKRYIDALGLSDAAKSQVFEQNVRRVFPRLDALLAAQGR